MLTVIVIILFTLVIAVDLRPSLKGAGAKDKIVYIAMLLISFAVLFLYSIDILAPSPSEPIKDVIDALFFN